MDPHLFSTPPILRHHFSSTLLCQQLPPPPGRDHITMPFRENLAWNSFPQCSFIPQFPWNNYKRIYTPTPGVKIRLVNINSIHIFKALTFVIYFHNVLIKFISSKPFCGSLILTLNTLPNLFMWKLKAVYFLKKLKL